MAQVLDAVMSDVDYRKFYWLYAMELVKSRSLITSGKFLDENDFSVDKVLRFAVTVDPRIAAELMVKYMVPANVPVKKEKKRAAEVVLPKVAASEIGKKVSVASPPPPVQEVDVSVCEHMEGIQHSRQKAVSAPPVSAICAMAPVKLPIDVITTGGFSAIFTGSKKFGLLEKQIHLPDDCSICAEIGPRIEPRIVKGKGGGKSKSSRVLLNHEKIYAIAAHYILGSLTGQSQYESASRRLAKGTVLLLNRYDSSTNSVDVTGLSVDGFQPSDKVTLDVMSRLIYGINSA